MNRWADRSFGGLGPDWTWPLSLGSRQTLWLGNTCIGQSGHKSMSEVHNCVPSGHRVQQVLQEGVRVWDVWKKSWREGARRVSFPTLFLIGRLQKNVLVLTYDIQELWEGFSRHELILKGPQHPFWSLIDGHVIMPYVLREREGPASLCVTGGHFL